MSTEKSAAEKSITSSVNDDRSLYVRSKSSNIVKKITHIFNWFNERDKKTDDRSSQLKLLATPQFNTSEKSRRFIVVSVCISH
jgi:isocitrate lyase